MKLTRPSSAPAKTQWIHKVSGPGGGLFAYSGGTSGFGGFCGGHPFAQFFSGGGAGGAGGAGDGRLGGGSGQQFQFHVGRGF